MKNIFKTITTGILLCGINTGVLANNVFTLENLERERAALLKTLTHSELSVHDREVKAETIYRRMVDAERMVLRDDRVTNSNSVLSKKAFENYELTFLVHASAEQDRQVLDHWLSELKLSSAQIQQTRVGFK